MDIANKAPLTEGSSGGDEQSLPEYNAVNHVHGVLKYDQKDIFAQQKNLGSGVLCLS